MSHVTTCGQSVFQYIIQQIYIHPHKVKLQHTLETDNTNLLAILFTDPQVKAQLQG